MENAESSIIPTINSYIDFKDFLKKHIVKIDKTNTSKTTNVVITNTRIGSKEHNVYGGCYHITDQEYPIFLALYNEHVLKRKDKEYLTEKQRDTDGPIAIDIDLRHSYETDERQYSKEHIIDLIDCYMEELKEMFQMDDSVKMPVYVFQKPTVNRLQDKNYTKDGIHIIIGLQADRIVQKILRERVMNKIKNVWTDIPITNSWDDVFDSGITNGTTNWQLFGSRKPNNDRYQLTYVFDALYESEYNSITYKETQLSKFDINANLYKLSVRYKDHLYLFMKSSFIDEYNRIKTGNTAMAAENTENTIRITSSVPSYDYDCYNCSIISKIRNREELDYLIHMFLDSLTNAEYELKDIYKYVNILPECYYQDGSYTKWIQILWILKNQSPKLLIVWIAFCARATNFDYHTIPELCERWNTCQRKENGLTKRSLVNWLKKEAKDEYNEIKKETTAWYIEELLNKPYDCGDCDLANLLHQMYKDDFVCVSVKANIWYQYKNHRYQENDSGTTLRKLLSTEVHSILFNMLRTEMSTSNTQNEELQEDTVPVKKKDESNRANKLLKICERLSRTNDKKNIMTEAKELFFDDKFFEKLDTNPYLYCFNNGVFDFKEKIFRPGYPDDYISICSDIDYIELDETVHGKIIGEINTFMQQLFPVKELCQYMWEHLASSLIGTSPNQTFNIYIGIGQNGKSVLVNLMEKVMGGYKCDVPLTLVTEKRGKVGGCTPEIVGMKGKRYAVMQEPSKTDRMNEGIMKQFTSGKDPIQARAPYMLKPISFIPQFNLIVTANVFMEIKSNDHGTWRRIRAVPFLSLFTENPVTHDKEKPYQYMIDKYIDEKFESWKEVFAAMLVRKVCETNGVVKDCDIVMEKSREYRKSQDYITEFMNDRLVRDATGRLKKTEVNNEFSIWYSSNYGGRCPSPKDLHELIDKEYGKQKSGIWTGVKVQYEKNTLNDDAATDSEPDEIDLL